MAGGAFISREKPCPYSLVTHFKKSMPQVSLTPTIIQIYSYFQGLAELGAFSKSKKIQTVVLGIGSWCRTMWNYLSTNTSTLWKEGKWNVGVAWNWIYCSSQSTPDFILIQSYSVTQIQTFIICVDTCPTKHKPALLGELCSELLCTSTFQPCIINRCLEVGLSMLIHLINTNSPFFPFCLYKSILREPAEQLWVLFCSSQNCVRALFRVLGIILVFLCTQVFVVNLHLCCTFKSASCSLAFNSPLLLLENNIIATKGIVIIILEIRFCTVCLHNP